MSKPGWRRRARSDDRGATLVEYALGIALILIVSIGAVTNIQSRGKTQLAASDDRVTPAADNQYYPGGSTPSTVPSTTTTTAPGSIAVHLQASPAVTVENATSSEWRVTVTFTLLDSSDNGVIGATMNGAWSDGGNGSNPAGTCSTSTSAGKCTLQFTSIKDNVSSVTFTLSSITGSGFYWQPATAGEGTLSVSCSPPLSNSCD